MKNSLQKKIVFLTLLLMLMPVFSIVSAPSQLHEYHSLSVTLTAEPLSVEAKDPVTFTIVIGNGSSHATTISTNGLTTFADDGERYYYKMCFGDGRYVVGSTDDTKIVIQHAYHKEGRYTAYVTVKDRESGKSGESEYISIEVKPMPNLAPVAMAGTVYRGVVGKPVVFDASTSYDPDEKILWYRWDFDNDGVWDTSWSSSKKAKHVYTQPFEGYVRLEVKDNDNATDTGIARVIILGMTGDIDQSQEKADGYVKLYEGQYFAQSFKPSMCGLTGLDIYVGKKGLMNEEENKENSENNENNGINENNNENGRVVNLNVNNVNENNNHFKLRGLFKRVLNWIFGRSSDFWKSGSHYNSSNTNLGFAELKIGIYSKLGSYTDENRLAYVTLSPDEISREGGWVHVDFPTKLELSWKETYYIVVYHSSGSDKRFYYKWYYGTGDPYSRGSSYSTDSYPWDWKEDKSKDFCFRTYGELTGDEPDGVVERWGVFVGVLEDKWGDIALYADNDAYDMRDVLVHHGWQSDHIKVLISPSKWKIEQAIKWLDSMDDGDDIVMFTVSAHGGVNPNNGKGGFVAYDGVFYYYQLDDCLDECDAEGQLVVVDTCRSGSAIWDMAQEGRVVLTSSSAEQFSGSNDEMKNGVFIYFLADETGVWSSRHGYPTPRVGKDGAFARDDPDTNENYGGNNDGWISAEEAFSYAKKWTSRVWNGRSVPQISDNYTGDLLIAKRG